MQIAIRDYQDDAIETVYTSIADYLVEFPTGSGKTILMVVLSCLLPVFKNKKVLIITTQEHIEDAFTDRAYETVLRTNGKTVPCFKEKIVAARDEDNSSVAAVVSFMAAPIADTKYAMVCTHAAFARIDPLATLPSNLENFVLLVDEAQHVPAARLSQLIEGVSRRGGRLLYFTATGFRADGDPVLRDGMLVLRRTLAQHMEEGHAPEKVVTSIVAVRANHVSAEQFAGEEVPPEDMQDLLVTEMVNAWKADDRPKSIVRVPGVRGGAGPLVAKAVAAFKKEGARVLDVSGNTTADRKRFLSELPDERKVDKYADSKYDVLVGVQRVNEGLDWPLCSTVYVVGLPTSLVLIAQLLGRATRLKWQAGYPKAHAKRAKIQFFVPCGEPSEELMEHHRRSTVLVIAHLLNATAAAEWAVIKDIGRGIVMSLNDASLTKATSVASNCYPKVDPAFRQEALQVFGAVRAQLLAGGSAAPDVDVLEMAYQRRPEIPRAMLRQVMVEYILTETNQNPNNTKAADRVRRRLQDEIVKSVAVGTPLKNAIRQAFEDVVIDLDSYAIVKGQQLADLETQIITLTGKGMRDIGDRLAEARPVTPDWLALVVQKHKDSVGTYPKETTTDPVPGWPEESWAKLDNALVHGKRGWPLASVRSLKEFVNKYVRQGPMRLLLEKFRHEGKLVPAENALLDSLLAQRVRVSKDETMAFGDTAVPSTGVWPKPKWWVLRAWWNANFQTPDGKLPPLSDVYASVFLTNLAYWLEQRHQISVPETWPTDGEVAKRYADKKFVGRVESDNSWISVKDKTDDEDGIVFGRHKEFIGIVSKGSSGSGLVRGDGVQEFSRIDAGQIAADIPVRVSYHGNTRSATKQENATCTKFRISLPLRWIRTIDGQPVPQDHEWIEKFAALPATPLVESHGKSLT